MVGASTGGYRPINMPYWCFRRQKAVLDGGCQNVKLVTPERLCRVGGLRVLAWLAARPCELLLYMILYIDHKLCGVMLF